MKPEPEVTLAELFELTGEQLPEDWQLVLSLWRGEIGVYLVSPDGDRVERDKEQEDMNVVEMILDCVNFARDCDGLMPVEFKGIGGET